MKIKKKKFSLINQIILSDLIWINFFKGNQSFVDNVFNGAKNVLNPIKDISKINDYLSGLSFTEYNSDVKKTNVIT